MTVNGSWQEWRCESFGLTLAGRFRYGVGEPVLALHGWLDNAASFEALAGLLPNPFLALDMMGHGLSSHRAPGVPYHHIDNVRDVLSALNAVGWERCILLGHSMGAGVSPLFAATFPERVSRLILIDGLGPGVSAPGDEPSVLRKAILDMQAVGGRQKPVYATREAAIEARTKGFGGLNHDASAVLCERGLEQLEQGFTWRADSRLRLSSSLRFTEQQIEHFFAGVNVPVLLIKASEGLGAAGTFDHRIPWIPNLEQVQVTGRHHVHMENPQVVAEAILPFLERTAR